MLKLSLPDGTPLPVLAGVSGGADSMCLATLLKDSGTRFGIAHCNFSLRGEESDGDEALVGQWARENGIPFHSVRFRTAEYASQRGISIEMAARELRYRFFGNTAREYGYGCVAVAHNANDNAETLILNLLRGTSLRGIAGMKAAGGIPDPEFSDIPLVRPLLAFEREEIEAFAALRGIPYRTDSTNLLPEVKRNKIRNLVFPVFREINPSFVRTLGRDMERFSEALETVLEHSPSSVEKDPEPLPPVRYTVTEELRPAGLSLKQPPGTLILDAEKAGATPVFGHWKAGDWIHPLGAPGKKKLQDWFTDHHFTPEMKRRAVLLRDPSDDRRILAIIGWCIDEKVKVTAATERILRIEGGL